MRLWSGQSAASSGRLWAAPSDKQEYDWKNQCNDQPDDDDIGLSGLGLLTWWHIEPPSGRRVTIAGPGSPGNNGRVLVVVQAMSSTSNPPPR